MASPPNVYVQPTRDGLIYLNSLGVPKLAHEQAHSLQNEVKIYVSVKMWTIGEKRAY